MRNSIEQAIRIANPASIRHHGSLVRLIFDRHFDLLHTISSQPLRDRLLVFLHLLFLLPSHLSLHIRHSIKPYMHPPHARHDIMQRPHPTLSPPIHKPLHPMLSPQPNLHINTCDPRQLLRRQMNIIRRQSVEKTESMRIHRKRYLEIRIFVVNLSANA